MAIHKCPKCERTFSMPAHLVRHLNATHGVRTSRKPGRPAGRRGRRPGRPRGSRNRVNRIKIDGRAIAGVGQTRILEEMSTYRDQLIAQRSVLDAQIAGLEGAIGMLSGNLAVPTRGIRRGPRRGRRGPGRPRGSGGRRGRRSEGGREGSLKQMIVRVLKSSSRPLTPTEIADGVIKVGYKTSAANLTKAVSNALPLISGIKKTGRDLYQA